MTHGSCEQPHFSETHRPVVWHHSVLCASCKPTLAQTGYWSCRRASTSSDWMLSPREHVAQRPARNSRVAILGGKSWTILVKGSVCPAVSGFLCSHCPFGTHPLISTVSCSGKQPLIVLSSGWPPMPPVKEEDLELPPAFMDKHWPCRCVPPLLGSAVLGSNPELHSC